MTSATKRFLAFFACACALGIGFMIGSGAQAVVDQNIVSEAMQILSQPSGQVWATWR